MDKLNALGYTLKTHKAFNTDEIIFSKREGNAIYVLAFYTEDKSFETYGFAKGHRINNLIDKPLLDAIVEMFQTLDFN